MSNESQTLNVLTLSQSLEGVLQKHLIQGDAGLELKLEPGLHQRLMDSLAKAVEYCRAEGYLKTAILCDPRFRRQLRRLIEKAYPHIPVISYVEVASGFTINNIRTIEL